MSQRPQPEEYDKFFEKYIALVPEEGSLEELLGEQAKAVIALFGELSEEQAAYRYAPGKWSFKQLLGHLIDSDRIMSYRMFWISRGDSTSLPGFDENFFVEAGQYDSYLLKDLIPLYEASRQSTLALVGSIKDEAWTRMGNANGHAISAGAQLCLMIGHERHHLNIIKERYLG
ncbi:DinB family protein [Paenibacillus sp. HN-1]|uniref:DinB family protein n=1 Tax=Paenibacillus TaxID=44249 RepID=UPI001CA7B873|nr:MULTISPECIES: DinB family protein [Paenibacillus]MBY9081528.1 DinB family protein [Paenibacillus sp. CGMCC 1.18879]MBY9087651.1 DinB family protein [Paenibacillus sinensis]